MAERLPRQLIAEKAIVHDAHEILAPRAPTTVDRSFELPTALYAITVGLFLGYIGLMAWGFAHPEMILPVAIFVLFVCAGFGVPALWVRMQPDTASKPKSWSRFQAEGVMTLTGRLKANEAAAQVLVMPAVLFLWGVAAVTIAALVR
ncbi:MAG: hypothetical protein B7Z08_10685 [Sphingomonadales bacterium 32-68-7]|nr:MAG: hypothetical protein B7Z33_12540 [Sphingomonadales bacterium 12-68-11]OYX08135.1 MAG: hypothetical protein B7Z08_10685 [Sphingomonadales bacterium 32-68-7]